MLIDTHCHLNFKAFENKVEEVIAEAKKAGVEKIIVPGTDLETSISAVQFAQKYENVWAAIGIHPHHAREIKDLEKTRQKLMHLGGSASGRVIAIGECGLDYYQYQKTKYENYQVSDDFKQKQKDLFILQIKLAHELKLPLIIHCREAANDLLKIISYQLKAKSLKLKGVFHCFDANEAILDWGLKHNFYFGVTGNVTYNQKVQQAVLKIPLTNLLIETDAPYLTPEPLRSQKSFPNQPKNVKIVALRIATIKSDSFLNVAMVTSNNAFALFKLKN